MAEDEAIPHVSIDSSTAATLSRKRSLSDMILSRSPSKVNDENVYCGIVLRLPGGVTEDELDQQLTSEAQELGLTLSDVANVTDGLSVSESATTIASDTKHPRSSLSQSTGPTSCSSSERHPPTQSPESQYSPMSPPQSATSSELFEKKRVSAFRIGFRRMRGFHKRRSVVIATSGFEAQAGDSTVVPSTDSLSIVSSLKSPMSIPSRRSSFSPQPSHSRMGLSEKPTVEDEEAVQRTKDCKELEQLRSQQLEERARFLEFQRSSLAQMRSEHKSARQVILDSLGQTMKDSRMKVRGSDFAPSFLLIDYTSPRMQSKSLSPDSFSRR